MGERLQTLRSLAEGVELQLLPWFNLLILLIPVVLVGEALTSSAANVVSATTPVDVAELETPTPGPPDHERATVQASPRSLASSNGDTTAPIQRDWADEQPEPGPTPSRPARPLDPLLGYGI